MKTALLFFFLPCLALAGEEAVSIKLHDGYAVDGKLALPAGEVTRAIVLVHGSGAHPADADLTDVSKGKQQNLVFRDVSDALVAKGFAVLRVNKRNWQIQQEVKRDRKVKDSAGVAAFVKDPFGYFVKDVESALDFLAARYPKAKYCLLGLSEGTYIALQVARERPRLAGVALIGYAGAPLACLVHEQVVYRPLKFFEELDRDHDGVLSEAELAAPGPIAAALLKQMPVLDLNGNKRLERDEFMAGNYSNLLIKPLFDPNCTVYESTHPTSAAILSMTSMPVCFFQGLWDNQCPAYQAKSVELVNRAAWKKPNLSFQYFDKMGHCLDPRDSYDDLEFRPMSKDALDAIGKTLDEKFK